MRFLKVIVILAVIFGMSLFSHNRVRKDYEKKEKVELVLLRKENKVYEAVTAQLKLKQRMQIFIDIKDSLECGETFAVDIMKIKKDEKIMDPNNGEK